MKQKQFEAANAVLWGEIRTILDGGQADARELPALYRRLCQCLALCRQRGYSPAIADYLQKMVGDCHRLLYGTAVERPNTLMQWMMVDLPCRVRAEWRLMLVACVAFFGVALGVGMLVWYDPHMAYSFMPPDKLAQMSSMYQPGNIRAGRGSEGDLQMFGLYIWNNISIDFRTFAGGVFGGIPALLVMAFNGMLMGVVAAWLSKDPGTAQSFWSFVITHASFEITGMLLAGVAGMKLGLALIHPGRRTRAHALQETSLHMFPILVGAALLTLLAAFFEAFWSASAAVPANLKYAVGALCWVMVVAFFLFAGRGRK